MLENNLLALIITFAAALVWLRINDFAAAKGWIDSQLSRKFIHIGTGPIFVLCWPLFNNTPNARFFAAAVPLVITLQFLLVGLGIMKDEASVKAMSRSGNPREILRGPLMYGIVFVVLTLIYWYDSPTGIVALMILCGGDGLADIVGRRWGRVKLPWSSGKSWAGSMAMFGGGFVLGAMILVIFVNIGLLSAPFSTYLTPLLVTALVATIVETFPIRDWDNVTVTLASVATWLLIT